MEDKKKDQIIQKVSNGLEDRDWGEGKASINISLTIDHESQKVIIGVTEREKDKTILL